jgi:hypothetical protein
VQALDQMMRAHLKKAAVMLTLFADEDRLDRGLHVVVTPRVQAPQKKAKARS